VGAEVRVAGEALPAIERLVDRDRRQAHAELAAGRGAMHDQRLAEAQRQVIDQRGGGGGGALLLADEDAVAVVGVGGRAHARQAAQRVVGVRGPATAQEVVKSCESKNVHPGRSWSAGSLL